MTGSHHPTPNSQIQKSYNWRLCQALIYVAFTTFYPMKSNASECEKDRPSGQSSLPPKILHSHASPRLRRPVDHQPCYRLLFCQLHSFLNYNNSLVVQSFISFSCMHTPMRWAWLRKSTSSMGVPDLIWIYNRGKSKIILFKSHQNQNDMDFLLFNQIVNCWFSWPCPLPAEVAALRHKDFSVPSLQFWFS